MYYNSPIFTGEIASLTNEILLNKYLYEQAKTDEEKILFLSKNIENYFTTVFKQVMYTEFENFLYGSDELTIEILNNEYKQLIKKYYGESVNLEGETFTDWTRLGHIYRWSYYPFKYATGLIMANIVASNIMNGSLSTNKYLEFLSSGSAMSIKDLLKIVNIDLEQEQNISLGFNNLDNDLQKLKKLI